MSNNMRTYRGWSSIEDAKLVEALLNMVNVGGFKSDNGFKFGYLLHLEHSMKESLPESGILGKPHIESRIKTMKKDWQVVYDILNATSGSGYDKERIVRTLTHPEYGNPNSRIIKGQPNGNIRSFLITKNYVLSLEKNNRAKSVIVMEEEANKEQEQEGDDDYDEEMEDNNHEYISVSRVQDQDEETSSTRKRKRKDMNKSHSMIKSFNVAVTLIADRQRIVERIE